MHIGISGQENIPTDSTFNVTDVNVDQSICQVDFATINNQPATSNQPNLPMTSPINVVIPNPSVNDTFSDSATRSATTNSAILLASVAGGILGLCTIFICIVGLIVIKKRKQNKIREGVFTTQSLTSMFKGYVTYTSYESFMHVNVLTYTPVKLYNISCSYLCIHILFGTL